MENEKRLIYANELTEGLKSLAGMFTDEIGFAVSLESVLWKVDAQPTVDAVEVVHAKWEQMGEADYKCSVCGFRFTSADPISMFQYCRCGAKMDGDGNG